MPTETPYRVIFAVFMVIFWPVNALRWRQDAKKMGKHNHAQRLGRFALLGTLGIASLIVVFTVPFPLKCIPMSGTLLLYIIPQWRMYQTLFEL